MSYRFGSRSKSCLATAHPQLVTICEEVIKISDFSVLCGYRDEATQNALNHQGLSKKKWPNSKHNDFPSKAIDVAPYPIDWNDTLAFARLFGIFQGVAHSKGVKLRWGGDWDGDGESNDQSFMDLGHIELLEE